MLEYWYKERRTLVDFRRGPLGPHFDGFAAYLKEKQYAPTAAHHILSRSCLFNDFLVERGVSDCREVCESVADSFLDHYLADFRTTSLYKTTRAQCLAALKRLLSYLRQIDAIRPREMKAIPVAYRWMLDPYLRYLQEDRHLDETTIQRKRVMTCAFLDGLGSLVEPSSMKKLRVDAIEQYLLKHLKDRPENRRSLTSALRGFLRFCAERRYTGNDLSGVIPSVPSYRYASLPRGMDDSALQAHA